MARLINIGFGNMVSSARVIAIVSPESAPIKRIIQEAKDKINSLEDEALDIPRDLVNANERLMIETVKVCYNKINSNKEDLEVLDKWINATRVKLKKNILIKQDKEEVNNRMYSAMHDILGPDVMKELDKVNEEEV